MKTAKEVTGRRRTAGFRRRPYRPEDRGVYGLLRGHEIRSVALATALGTFVAAAVLDLWSFWWLAGFAGFIAPLAHFCFAGTRSLAFPLFLPAIFSLQHIISTAYLYNHPSFMTKSRWIFSLSSEYVPLAVLTTWVMYLGVVAPIMGLRPIVTWHKQDFSARLRKRRYTRVLEVTFWLSIVIGLAGGVLNLSSPRLAFLLLLISKLSYVSVVALGIIRSRRFGKLLVILAAVEVQKALLSTIFHPLLFFFLMICCLMVFSGKRWSPIKVALVLCIMALSVYMLQSVKKEYRKEVKLEKPGTLERVAVLHKKLFRFLMNPAGIFSEYNLGKSMDRFDQGQTVTLVMRRVPSLEPYARGETIKTALKAAVIPRIFDPDKYGAGGSVFFERFTGLKLIGGTSMNLGQLAEFYANYGQIFAVIGCGIYALVLGFIWRGFHNRGLSNPIWWAWFPFIALQMVKTEDGLGEIINHCFKAAVIAFLVIKFVPEWREVLNIKRGLFRGRDARAPVKAFQPPKA